jgi:hypothetical protein
MTSLYETFPPVEICRYDLIVILDDASSEIYYA